MRTLLTLILTLLLVPVGFFFVADRPLGDLIELARAGAHLSVNGAIEQVPIEVRDRKLDHDVENQRRQLTDHQVALNLSRRELGLLEVQVLELEERGTRRQRLLAEAYPVLESAMAEERTDIEFAGSKYSLEGFQTHLDELLAEDQREARQLEIRRAGLAKLTASIADGERALSDMRDSLLALEQEIDLLRTRRNQARLEGQTLELVSAVAGAPLDFGSALGAEADQLRVEVDRLEAGNEARRSVVPAAGRTNRVAADWERLERLRAIHGGEAEVEAEDTVAALPEAWEVTFAIARTNNATAQLR
ncbi:hypothetical protein [Engelhardtia mirabilis]|uniref:Uncharacterized protein n=1 Tax=Engelhardtia mirabilis TaxID=2528011 RepID=A0A518BQQ9_9BACT|nr:hypothetical protein Pla133_44280 [Planctomycetes bacterium Pla133]QDV03635.1 hypothetical protein Pla86_44260 [Planctomycetes bacterium Pla86]